MKWLHRISENETWGSWEADHHRQIIVSSIPKCASHSVRSWFATYTNGRETDRLNRMMWRHRCDILMEYKSLLVARDPWTRLVSAFRWIVARRWDSRFVKAAEVFGGASDALTFRQFVQVCRYIPNVHWMPIADYVPFVPGAVCTPETFSSVARAYFGPGQYILPCDNAQDWDPLPDWMSTMSTVADSSMTSLRGFKSWPDYRHFYDDKLRDEVAELYADDIRRFDLAPPWEYVT